MGRTVPAGPPTRHARATGCSGPARVAIRCRRTQCPMPTPCPALLEWHLLCLARMPVCPYRRPVGRPGCMALRFSLGSHGARKSALHRMRVRKQLPVPGVRSEDARAAACRPVGRGVLRGCIEGRTWKALRPQRAYCTSVLSVRINPRAVRQISRAAEWWAENRQSAPGAPQRLGVRLGFAGQRARGIGTKVETSRPRTVRRLYLGRVRYFVYYRVSAQFLEVVAFWHQRRAHDPLV